MKFIYSVLVAVVVFAQISILYAAIPEQNIIDEFEKSASDYEAPASLKKALPWYVSGRDKEGRLVLVLEISHWNIDKIAKATEPELEEINKYMLKMIQVIRNPNSIFKNQTSRGSNNENDDEEEENLGIGMIVDIGELSIAEATPKLLRWAGLQARYARVTYEATEWVYFVNTSAGASFILNILRPAFGALTSKMEILGTNKERWIPKLLARINRDQLPEWYGGTKNFKPLAYYG